MGLRDCDVAIVGYGPVGQTMAALLGSMGHRVAVFERFLTLYPLPRACVIDDEAMRILQRIGVAEEFSQVAVPTSGEYIWLNAHNETLYHFKHPAQGICGWPARNLMYQPDLERLLHTRIAALETVEVNRGWQATACENRGDYVDLTVEADQTPHQRRLTARYVIGADGANSFVRRAANLEWIDLGFKADWLVVDFRPHHPEKTLDMPEAAQICDPARPITLMRHLGRRHVRWEMMLLPGEPAQEISRPERVWPMIARWVSPQDGVIERAAVYTFRSGVAQSWVRGSVVLVGDAAHLMPPFLGQGLCSGMRDALSLAWRLDLLLRGVGRKTLLHSYEQERKDHVTAVIARAVALGKIVCVTDPVAAAQRDEQIRSGVAQPIPPFPQLTSGLLYRGSTEPQAVAATGRLSLQARVRRGGTRGLFDDVVGYGWTVVTLDSRLEGTLSVGQRAFLASIGTRFVSFGDDANAVDDIDGHYRAFLAELGARALIIRPDFNIFAVATSVAEVPGMVEELRRQVLFEKGPAQLGISGVTNKGHA